jgi:hypothetical protein
MHENEIGTVIVDCAVYLHKDLGPGLLETVYEGPPTARRTPCWQQPETPPLCAGP